MTETPLYGERTGVVFLGRYDSRYGRSELWTYDLYWARQARQFGEDWTVIARWGSEDSEYYSGKTFAEPYTDTTGARQKGIPMLVEAKARAERLGLIGPAADHKPNSAQPLAPNLLSYEREIVSRFVVQARQERERLYAELAANRLTSGSLLYVLRFLMTT